MQPTADSLIWTDDAQRVIYDRRWSPSDDSDKENKDPLESIEVSLKKAGFNTETPHGYRCPEQPEGGLCQCPTDAAATVVWKVVTTKPLREKALRDITKRWGKITKDSDEMPMDDDALNAKCTRIIYK